MSSKKKAIRRNFRLAVFERDGYCCAMCGIQGQDRQEGDQGLPDLDAHHITDRNEMPSGGYVKENGISLCTDCHIKAEDKILHFRPEDLYQEIGSSYEQAVQASERLTI
jgi:5-methylcytosine-specific restriction endonuclease McrA